MKKPKLEMFDAPFAQKIAIGFRRQDVPMVHVIAQEKPGDPFQVDDHFAACEVCKAHGITHDDFHAWYQAQPDSPS